MAQPTVGVVLGSGLGAFGERLETTTPYAEIPGMPVSTVAGHAGVLRQGLIGNVPVACLSGRVHLYEGHEPDAVVYGVRMLARLGCRAVLLTNAAGGIAEGLAPGSLMLIRDHLNLTGRNPLAGAGSGTRFVDMTRAYDPRFVAFAREAAVAVGTTLHEGVYAGVLGPSYETPAEILMLRALGADAVGMSTVLEVIALRQLGVRVGAISCITNLGAGIAAEPLRHGDVEAIAQRTSAGFVALMTEWVARVGKEVAQ
jgi:purine-nucleoside phosphorylase